MSDATYQSANYQAQGGNTWVIGTNGTLEINGAVTGLTPGVNVFVDSVTGSNSNDGSSWANAVATIDYAVSLCTANKGNKIFVAPGHTETVTAASGIDLDVAGISVIGLGQGTNRPTITMGTATSASLDFSAANCRICNLRFACNIDNLAAFIIGGANDATIEDCEFANGSSKEYLTAITVPTTYDNWTIRRCRFIQASDPAGTNGGAGTGCIYIVDSENVLIEDCEFRGNFETALIHNKTTAATNLWVRRCWGIMGTATADALPFVLVSTASGGVAQTYITNPNSLDVTEATFTGTFGAAFFNFQSYFGNDGGGGQLAVAGQTAAS